jgi:aryl-alcohol dehydrogenase-like predicted oxidoreductase
MDEDLERPDESEELDSTPVFASSNHDAEMEALAIRGLLESNGIPAVLVGPSTIPSLEFQVQVPKMRLEEAERVIAEAKAAGPAAAAEAERASENQG